ncbi:uncharacterized protein LOC135619674 [Musa acuminata AAA Group]|uniref:uncharacterized protein LOC135619674 n=1 Tax=Musa acuminata AAA Group TaxID=214697 RepID=UPI0031DB7DBE
MLYMLLYVVSWTVYTMFDCGIKIFPESSDEVHMEMDWLSMTQLRGCYTLMLATPQESSRPLTYDTMAATRPDGIEMALMRKCESSVNQSTQAYANIYSGLIQDPNFKTTWLHSRY